SERDHVVSPRHHPGITVTPGWSQSGTPTDHRSPHVSTHHHRQRAATGDTGTARPIDDGDDGGDGEAQTAATPPVSVPAPRAAEPTDEHPTLSRLSAWRPRAEHRSGEPDHVVDEILRRGTDWARERAAAGE